MEYPHETPAQGDPAQGGLAPAELAAVRAACKALDDKFATDIVALDIRKLSPIADCFIIAGGSNLNQIRAMTQAVEEKLFALGLRLGHIEGIQTGNWVLMDFGSIIVHIFDKESRAFYNLERLWSDAETVPVSTG
ncbi:MAG: ribosome silencing factor [Firmicutes bacterium]|nr:ribosome silencing factor [Bacillota bacterium]